MISVDNPLFGDNTVYFGKARTVHVDCQSRGQAELIARLANLGVTGDVTIPPAPQSCLKLLDRVDVRREKAATRFKEFIESRTGDERVRQQLAEVLQRWFVLGREGTVPDQPENQPATE